MKSNRPYMLIILDGWGIGDAGDTNAVYTAHTPVLDGLVKEYPRTRLRCSGEAVGLPAGFMGNSEVGHLNIGAGRVVYQDLMRIDNAIKDGRFFENPVFSHVMETVREKGTALHLMGLASESGVHSHLRHLYALLKMASDRGVSQTHIHAITDGRDSPPNSGIEFVRQIQKHLDDTGYGAIATICGRYYAMDRDKRWQRTQTAYDLYLEGAGRPEALTDRAVLNAYERGETDEFIKPVVMIGEDNRPRGIFQEGDGVIVFNFRADRVRQITHAFTNLAFKEFDRKKVVSFCDYACMTTYDETFDLPVAFPPVRLKKILGEVISNQGLSQLRIAETEKYAHVTYFFNGGEETPFPLEDRCLIPSPKEVPTYDHKPEMSAFLVTDELLKRMQAGYDVMVLNFANMDMVGHTGIMSAAVKACETVDRCLGKILQALKRLSGVAIVTADHGNAEKMMDENNTPYTAHTHNPVPLILVDDSRKSVTLRQEGILGDIAPTLLDIMGIEKPVEMTGNSLINHSK